MEHCGWNKYRSWNTDWFLFTFYDHQPKILFNDNSYNSQNYRNLLGSCNDGKFLSEGYIIFEHVMFILIYVGNFYHSYAHVFVSKAKVCKFYIEPTSMVQNISAPLFGLSKIATTIWKTVSALAIKI